MSFWNPETTYPPHAETVTFKATASQKARWSAAAKRYHKGSRGAYIAWAADLAAFFLEAWEQANVEREQEMHLWDRDRKG